MCSVSNHERVSVSFIKKILSKQGHGKLLMYDLSFKVYNTYVYPHVNLSIPIFITFFPPFFVMITVFDR